MKKSILFLLVFLIAGFIGLLFFGKPTKSMPPRNHATVNEKPVKSEAKPSLGGNGSFFATDFDAVDTEIEKHGYHPSTEQEREKARKSYLVARDGANAKLTFHVTDSKGLNVTNASIRVSFNISLENRTERKGKTDENGVFVAEGKTSYDVECTVEGEGYYKTYFVWQFTLSEGHDVKNGKWVPWNPTIEVMLKEKRNPILMYKKWVNASIPVVDALVGFDFEKGDWVAPYGRGSKVDMYMRYAEPINVLEKTVERSLTITFPDERDGLSFYRKDEHTDMASIYEARDVDYLNPFKFIMKWKDGQLVDEKMLDQVDYLVFRVRTETNENGNIISAHYGKFDGPLRFGVGQERKVSFICYFNPTQNDRNLEYGGNLFNDRDARRARKTPLASQR